MLRRATDRMTLEFVSERGGVAAEIGNDKALRDVADIAVSYGWNGPLSLLGVLAPLPTDFVPARRLAGHRLERNDLEKPGVFEV
jgi:hypothetical protein